MYGTYPSSTHCEQWTLWFTLVCDVHTNDLYHRNWSCPSIYRCYLLMLRIYGTCHRILMEILGILQLSIASFHKWWWQLLWSTQFPQKALCKFVTVTATQLFIYACAELRSVVFDPQKTRNKFDIWIVCVCVCDISKDRAGLVRALHCFNKHCGQPQLLAPYTDLWLLSSPCSLRAYRGQFQEVCIPPHWNLWITHAASPQNKHK